MVLRISFWIVILSIASFQAWSGRFEPFVADTISYLDMADFIRHGQFSTAVSSYWSPAYPVIVAIFETLLNPKPADCFAVMKIANLFIFICTGVVFEIFLNELYRLYKAGFEGDITSIKISEFFFKLNCYAVFAWTFLTLGGAEEDTPDYLMSFFMLAACAITIRIQRTKESNPRQFGWLGLTLGLAFMTKSFAAVLCPIYIVYALFSIRKSKKLFVCLTSFVVVFAAVSMPYTLMLKAAGRTSTIFSAAKLNYLWTVLEGPAIIDDFAPEYKHLKHPPQLIFQLPKIYYFAKPIPGTFPLWYDVGYWSDGVIVNFNARLSSMVFLADWFYYLVHFLCFPILSWFVVAFIGATPALAFKPLVRMRVPLTVATTALYCYSMIVNVIQEQPQTQRYFPCFTVFLFAGMLASIRVKRSNRSIIALALMTITTIIYCSVNLKRELRITNYNAQAASNESQEIALALNKAGLKPGDEIALLANGDKEISHLKMAGLRFVATIAEPANYWTEPATTRKEISRILQQHGMKAIVFRTKDPFPTSAAYWQGLDVESRMVKKKNSDVSTLVKAPMRQYKFFDPEEGWQRVGTTGCYYLLL